MERAFHLVRLISLAAVMVVFLLCLSYTHAYGYSATVGINEPSNTNVTNNSGTGTNHESATLDHNWDRDTYVLTDNNSEDGSPASAVPEPGTLILLGTGLVGLARFARRRS